MESQLTDYLVLQLPLEPIHLLAKFVDVSGQGEHKIEVRGTASSRCLDSFVEAGDDTVPKLPKLVEHVRIDV